MIQSQFEIYPSKILDSKRDQERVRKKNKTKNTRRVNGRGGNRIMDKKYLNVKSGYLFSEIVLPKVHFLVSLNMSTIEGFPNE